MGALTDKIEQLWDTRHTLDLAQLKKDFEGAEADEHAAWLERAWRESAQGADMAGGTLLVTKKLLCQLAHYKSFI